MVQYGGIGLYIITMLLPLYLKDMKATATLVKMRSQHKQIFTNTKTGYALYTVIGHSHLNTGRHGFHFYIDMKGKKIEECIVCELNDWGMGNLRSLESMARDSA